MQIKGEITANRCHESVALMWQHKGEQKTLQQQHFFYENEFFYMWQTKNPLSCRLISIIHAKKHLQHIQICMWVVYSVPLYFIAVTLWNRFANNANARASTDSQCFRRRFSAYDYSPLLMTGFWLDLRQKCWGIYVHV